MKFLTRLQGMFHKLRRTQTYKRNKNDLREFVYLDEVSVYSLIASQLGSIATEFTETQTNLLQGSIEGSFGVNTGIVRGEENSNILASNTIGSQVIRKSIIQTQFTELYDFEKDNLLIKPISNEVPPIVKNLDELIALFNKSGKSKWIIKPSDLKRGELFETEVLLEAEDIFKISAALSSLFEIIGEDFKIFGVNVDDNHIQVKTIERILEKLLAGLVPIKGHAVDYKIIEYEHQQWIIHEKILRQLNIDNLNVYKLFVVGVAEQRLFWKDIRQVLFAKANYRVLCRIAIDGLQNSWTPVKFVQVLETVSPDLAKQLNDLGSGALNNLSANPIDAEAKSKTFMKDALVEYANLLAKHYEFKLTEQNLVQINLISQKFCGFYNTQTERRKAFDVIAQYIIETIGVEKDSTLIAEYRAIALFDAGLDFSGKPLPLVTAISNQSSLPSNDRFIDSEFVAIYW